MTFLIDSENLWYRAFTATDLTPPGGPLTVVMNMLRAPLKKFSDHETIFCWGKGRSGRDKLDPEYKANRTPAPGVWENIIYFKKLVTAAGFASAYLDGFEADDVIGSLAAQDDREVLIFSEDKDFYQLVSNRIRIFKPKRNYMGRKIPEKIIEIEDVVEKLECTPEKAAMLKAFKGDKSDNIPKIKMRFAKNFKIAFFRALEASETLDDFFASVPSAFERKYQNALLAFQDRAKLNYELIKIKTDLQPQIFRRDPSQLSFDRICTETDVRNLRFNDFVAKKERV